MNKWRLLELYIGPKDYKDHKTENSQEENMEVEDGQLFPHLLTASSIRAAMTQNQTLSLSSTSRGLHCTDLIYTD